VNVLSQAIAINFKNNGIKGNSVNNTFKKESNSFQNVLDNKFENAKHRNSKFDKRMNSTEYSSQSKKNNIKSSTNTSAQEKNSNVVKDEVETEQANESKTTESEAKLDSKLDSEVQQINEKVKVDECADETLTEVEVEEIEKMLLDLINLLMNAPKEEIENVVKKINVVLEEVQSLDLSEQFKQETAALSSELSNLLVNANKENLSKDQKSLISEKLNSFIEDFKMEIKQDSNKIETDVKKVVESIIVEEEPSKTSNNHDTSDSLHAEAKDVDVAKKTIGKGFNSQEQKVSELDNAKFLDNNDPKDMSVTMNRTIRDELLSKVSTNGLPAKVSADNIMTQISSQITKVSVNGANEIKIQLMPENLGKLSLKITSLDNVVTAKIMAESLQVKEVIESNLNQLRDSLSEKGLSISNIEVFVGQDSDTNRHKQALQQTIKSKKSSGNQAGEIQTLIDDSILNISTNPYLDDNSFDMKG